MLTKNGICNLADFVIADLTWAYLLPWSYTTQGFVAFDIVKAKERSFRNSHPTNQFLPLVVEVFGCLQITCRCVFTWLCQCHLEFERAKGLHHSTLVIFLCKKLLITLQRMQVSSILSQTIAVSLSTPQLPPLQDTLPITSVDLLQADDFWHINMADLPQLWTWRDFHNYFEPTWWPITSPFSFILLLCTFL